MKKTSYSCAEVYIKTASQLGLSEETVKAVIYSMWSGLKKGIRKGDSHGFLIHNFGTFEVFHQTLNNEIRKVIGQYKAYTRKKGFNPKVRKNFEDDFRMLWSLRQAAMKTKKDKRLKSSYR